MQCDQSFPAGFGRLVGTLRVAACVAALITLTALNAAGQATLIEIRPGNGGSNPSQFINFNGAMIMSADNGSLGAELWKSDGTVGGTVLIKDINPGPQPSAPANMILFNSLVYFTATDGTNGVELWRTDGTTAGTQMVFDLAAGAPGSSPHELVVYNGALYFAADNAIAAGPTAFGIELYRFDGTNVTLVKDIAFDPLGGVNSNPTSITVACNPPRLFFAATDGVLGRELWVSDGTTAGTQLVKDIRPGASNATPTNLVAVGNLLYFAADDSVIGNELWQTDGTTAGTVVTLDVRPGPQASNPVSMIALNGNLLFAADNGSVGLELWKAVPGGSTAIVKDIRPGIPGSGIINMVESGGVAYFSASDGSTGAELWKSDGTNAGTVLVRDIFAGSGSASPGSITSIVTGCGSGLMFAADGGNGIGNEPYHSNGTLATTLIVADVFPGNGNANPAGFKVSGNNIFFQAQDGVHGNELWVVSTSLFGDTVPPVITGCPTNIVVNAANGLCSANVSWTPPTATDNCTVASFTSTHSPGAPFPVGTTTVTYTAVDFANLTTTCSFTVTVNDTQAPVFANCAPNSSAAGNATCQATLPDLRSGVSATDNCGGVTLAQSPIAGTVLGVGPHTITFTATDTHANSSTCTSTFTVLDVTAPVITQCASNASGIANTNCQAAVPDMRAGVLASDGCTSVTIVQSPAPGTLLGFGPHTVTFTVSDTSSNSTTCTATFTVIDIVAPTITSCAPASQASANAACQTTLPDLRAGVVASDNCGSVTISQSPSIGSVQGIGPHTITFTVTDASSNSTTCTSVFTVVDTTAPVITNCGVNAQANANASCQAAVPDMRAAIVATDNCSAVTVSQSPAPGTLVGLGPQTVTLTATDTASNSSTCTRTFTVIDVTAPVITTCAANAQASAGATCQANVPDMRSGVIASDVCGAVAVTQSPTAGTAVGIGPHTVTFTVTDGSSNTTTCTAIFTVVDTTAPTITSCGSNTQANANASCQATVPDMRAAVVATDNCSAVTVTQSPVAGTLTGIGPHTITFTVVDAASNAATCTRTFTVVDVTAPVITTCAPNAQASAGPACTATVPDMRAGVVAADNCGTVTVSQVPAPGSSTGLGPHAVTFTVTDAANNTATCSATFTVLDTTAPTITTCAQGAQAIADGACHATVPDLRSGVVASDDCGAVVITQSPAAGSIGNLGPNTITFTATDGSSNTTTCTTTFTIVDIAAPTITCPPNVTVNSIPGQCIATNVSLGTPTVSDNCGILSISNNAPPVFFAGTSQVTWLVLDTSNHVATCTQTVTVIALPPLITTQPANQNGVIGHPVSFSVSATGIGFLTYQWRLNGSPISGATGSTFTIPSVGAGSVGNYTVVVTDACGQQVTSTPASLTLYDLLFALSQPLGTGSLAAVNTFGPAGAAYFSAFSVDPTNGTSPGTGFWFGLTIGLPDLIDQFLAGAPPFVGQLDPTGGSSFVLPPFTVTPALNGITLYGLTSTFNPATFTPTGHSNVASVTFQ